MVVRASDNGPARRPQRWTLHSIPIDESVVAAAPLAPDPGPDPEAEAGARVLGGRYVLLELLCHGELGGVYLGRDRIQNRSVEVKLLAPAAAESASAVSYLRSRARRALGIRHAHVAAVYDENLDEENLPFFVTEHVEGRNLHHMQGDPRLTGAAVQALALQLAEGLAALHGRGVVHGAVTPGNIVWLEDDGRPVQVKLVDREVSPDNAEAHGYRSPGAHDRPPDEAADLYALGAVVYELVTGRLPWADPDSEPRLRGDDLPLTVTAAFEAIVLDLIRPDPAPRAAGARALCERLTTVVGPPPPRPAPPRPAQAEPSQDEFSAFADAWLDGPADAELTRFRPVEDGPATPAAPPATPSTPAAPPAPPEPDDEPTSLSSAEYTELGSAELPELSASALTEIGGALAAAGAAASTASLSGADALESSSAALTAALARSSAALTGPTAPDSAPVAPFASPIAPQAPLEPRSYAVDTRPATPPSEPSEPALDPIARPPRAPWRLIATVVIVVLLIVVLWQLARGGSPAEVPVDTPIAAPQTSAQLQPAPRPDDTTLARTHEPAPTPPAPPEPEPAPALPATAPDDLPEQLSAGEFRKVLLRANRLGSTRACYRKHSPEPDRSVELVAIVSPEGKIQKLKLGGHPLADCLRKVVLALEFSPAQKPAQHNFVFHHPDVNQPG